MCGVIGVWMKNADTQLVRRLFRETQIRGKHATGLSFVRDDKIWTYKSGKTTEVFFNNFDINNVVNEDGGIYLIGHIRYSTSNLKYNQPFSDENMSIVHNGVISQEPVRKWKYYKKVSTENDSEQILHSYNNGQHPLKDFKPSSQAVCTLQRNKTLTGYRNEARPLWWTKIHDGIIFTSTKDIALRSGLINPQKCGMYWDYIYQDNELNFEVVEAVNIEDLQV